MFLRSEIFAIAMRSATQLGFLATATVALPASAHAQAAGQTVVLTSEAHIERTEIGADGKEKQVLKNPNDVIVVPGDKVVFALSYVNKGTEAASGFRATNPMPGPVQFVSAAEEWAEVSVDGGKSWGKLAGLKVTVPGVDGSATTERAASAEDVTHVRWVFAEPIAPGAKGSVSYRGLIK